MDQKIISVIGGSGFIGNYLIDKLLELGYYVKIISRNSNAKKNFYPSSKLGQYALISCNICNSKKLDKVIIYEALGSGNAVQYFTGWHTTQEALVEIRENENLNL